MTGLEAAAAAKAVVQLAGREWLAVRRANNQRGKDLSELIQVSFSDRFAQRRLERQLADIADSVERRLGALISVEYGGLADNDRVAVFAEVTAALEHADLSDSALLSADADPVILARQVRAGMAPMAGQLGDLETTRSKHGKPVIGTRSQHPTDCADMSQRSPVY